MVLLGNSCDEGEEALMRVLIISDIHANLAALETVLEDAKGQWDSLWCLGDVIGYGPAPNECAAILKEQAQITLSGNHDWAVLGKIDINTFNRDARAAINWTQDTINEETRLFLNELPAMIIRDPFTLAHASPRYPVWEYILDKGTAAINFAYFDTPWCLVGHTHTPVIFEEIDGLRVTIHPPNYQKTVHLNGNRLIINPGSVGQPRDSDPRAAYAILDLEKMHWEYRRVVYPIEKTQERMRQYGLPQRLIARLEHGW